MKTNKFINYFLLTISIVPFLTSCEDDNKVEDVKISTGVYVLNAGKFGKNNSTITYYDYTSGFAATDVFAQKNSRILGDTGEDIIQYGGKAYIAVYGSSVIEVVNPTTMTSIKTISIKDNQGTSLYPRTLAAANGKLYVVLYSGSVAQLDTVTLSVEKTVKVGTNPDKCVLVNNKLYVGNTGGMATVKDSTVSVINLSTFTEEKKIVVNLNPSGDLGADSQGDVYVQSNGKYNKAFPPKFQRIEAGTGKVSNIVLKIGNDTATVRGFKAYKDKAYIYTFDYDPSWQAINKRIVVYDLKNERIISENLVGTTTLDKTPYAIGVDPGNGDVYLGVTDYENSGMVYCFSSTGTQKFTFNSGLNPAHFLFVTEN